MNKLTFFTGEFCPVCEMVKESLDKKINIEFKNAEANLEEIKIYCKEENPNLPVLLYFDKEENPHYHCGLIDNKELKKFLKFF